MILGCPLDIATKQGVGEIDIADLKGCGVDIPRGTCLPLVVEPVTHLLNSELELSTQRL
jgi:hypothetical protein